MSGITVHDLDPETMQRLRSRAVEHGHSVEAEVQRILETALRPPAERTGRDLVDLIQAHVAPLGGIELELPPRDRVRALPSFD